MSSNLEFEADSSVLEVQDRVFDGKVEKTKNHRPLIADYKTLIDHPIKQTNYKLKYGTKLYKDSFEFNKGTTVVSEMREIIMMGAVNYLGLSHHPKIVNASLEAISQNGVGGIGSRFSNGVHESHFELESVIKTFFDTEDCLTFNSGYMANLGTISCFGRDSVIFSDKENHLSIYDSCRLAGGKVFRFQHNSPDHFEFLLKK